MDKRGRDQVAAIELEHLLRNTENNRWGGGYFEFTEPKASSGKHGAEQKWTRTRIKHRGECKCEIFIQFSHHGPQRIWYRRKGDTIYSSQSCVRNKAKMKDAEAEDKLKKAEFIFMIDPKTLIHKTSVDPKMLQLKICVRNKQKERPPEKLSPVFSKITQRNDSVRSLSVQGL